MSAPKMGGPAFPDPAVKRKRFRYMRYTAERAGKYAPSFAELERVTPSDMRCPSCGVAMNWLAKHGQKTVISLQHNRDGSLQMLCRTCNTRHAFCDGDSFYEIPEGHKRCAGCETVQPLNEFWTDNHKRWNAKQTYCKKCASARGQEWRKENREQYNRYMREYRAKRKTQGNPVASGS